MCPFVYTICESDWLKRGNASRRTYSEFFECQDHSTQGTSWNIANGSVPIMSREFPSILSFAIARMLRKPGLALQVTRWYTYTQVCIYKHAYIYTNIHTYIHTYIHAYMHTYIHVHTYIQTSIHTYMRIMNLLLTFHLNHIGSLYQWRRLLLASTGSLLLRVYKSESIGNCSSYFQNKQKLDIYTYSF